MLNALVLFAHGIEEDSILIQDVGLCGYCSRGNFSIHARTMSMFTLNEGELKDDYANGGGMGLGYESERWKGLGFKVNGFFMFNVWSSQLEEPDSLSHQVSRYEAGLFDVTNPGNRADLDRLEEAYLSYRFKNTEVRVGRMNIQTPFINAQDGRMRPSLEEGVYVDHLSKKAGAFYGAFFWAFSPRSTVLWYRGMESIGVLSPGLNVDGTRSNYTGNLDGKVVATVGWKYNSSKWRFELNDVYVDQIFNTAFVQTEYTFGHSNLTVGQQIVRQDKVASGGNEDPSKAFFHSEGGSWVFSTKLSYKRSRALWTLAYTGVTNDGRFIFPREWGREPFYTFMSRERIEGSGDVSAFMLAINVKSQKVKGLTFYSAFTYAEMPALTDFRLSKYVMPNYIQHNTTLKYEFNKRLQGLDLFLMITEKWEAESGELEPTNKYNKVNLIHTTVAVNYHFQSKSQHNKIHA